MSNHEQEYRQQGSRRVTGSLHPAVYMALVGLTLWLGLAIWGNAGPHGVSSEEFGRAEEL